MAKRDALDWQDDDNLLCSLVYEGLGRKGVFFPAWVRHMRMARLLFVKEKDDPSGTVNISWQINRGWGLNDNADPGIRDGILNLGDDIYQNAGNSQENGRINSKGTSGSVNLYAGDKADNAALSSGRSSGSLSGSSPYDCTILEKEFPFAFSDLRAKGIINEKGRIINGRQQEYYDYVYIRLFELGAWESIRDQMASIFSIAGIILEKNKAESKTNNYTQDKGASELMGVCFALLPDIRRKELEALLKESLAGRIGLTANLIKEMQQGQQEQQGETVNDAYKIIKSIQGISGLAKEFYEDLNAVEMLANNVTALSEEEISKIRERKLYDAAMRAITGRIKMLMQFQEADRVIRGTGCPMTPLCSQMSSPSVIWGTMRFDRQMLLLISEAANRNSLKNKDLMDGDRQFCRQILGVEYDRIMSREINIEENHGGKPLSLIERFLKGISRKRGEGKMKPENSQDSGNIAGYGANGINGTDSERIGGALVHDNRRNDDYHNDNPQTWDSVNTAAGGMPNHPGQGTKEQEANSETSDGFDLALKTAGFTSSLGIFKHGSSECLPWIPIILNLTLEDASMSLSYIEHGLRQGAAGAVFDAVMVRNADMTDSRGKSQAMHALSGSGDPERILRQAFRDLTEKHRAIIQNCGDIASKGKNTKSGMPMLNITDTPQSIQDMNQTASGINESDLLMNQFAPGSGLFAQDTDQKPGGDQPSATPQVFRCKTVSFDEWVSSGKVFLEDLEKYDAVKVLEGDIRCVYFKGETVCAVLHINPQGYCDNILSARIGSLSSQDNPQSRCITKTELIKAKIRAESLARKEMSEERRAGLLAWFKRFFMTGYNATYQEDDASFILQDPGDGDRLIIMADDKVEDRVIPVPVSEYVLQKRKKITEGLIASMPDSAIEASSEVAGDSLYMRLISPYTEALGKIRELSEKAASIPTGDILDIRKRNTRLFNIRHEIDDNALSAEAKTDAENRLSKVKAMRERDPLLAECMLMSESFYRDSNSVKGIIGGESVCVTDDLRVSGHGNAFDIMQERMDRYALMPDGDDLDMAYADYMYEKGSNTMQQKGPRGKKN